MRCIHCVPRPGFYALLYDTFTLSQLLTGRGRAIPSSCIPSRCRTIASWIRCRTSSTAASSTMPPRARPVPFPVLCFAFCVCQGLLCQVDTCHPPATGPSMSRGGALCGPSYPKLSKVYAASPGTTRMTTPHAGVPAAKTTHPLSFISRARYHPVSGARHTRGARVRG